MRSSKSRSRNKNNRNRSSSLGNIVNRVFDSNGPEGKSCLPAPCKISAYDKWNTLFFASSTIAWLRSTPMTDR